jgi:5-methylthioadenosine/S-adenosylhomocysteine deaminase
VAILIKDARVLTMNDALDEYDDVDILIDGTKIVAVGHNLVSPGDAGDIQVVEAAGKLAMPGLVNGHLHSPGNLRRGALDNLPLEIFMLYEVPPLSKEPEDGRTNYLRTLLGNIEMLKWGITSVHDDAFYVPYPTPEAIDGLMQAHADSGMRAVAAIDQPNVIEYEKYPFLREILPENIRLEMEYATVNSKEDLLACYQHLIRNWHNSYGGRLRAGVSVSAPQRVTVDYFAELSEISQSLRVPLNVHILETKLQRVLGETKYGQSLVKYVRDLGFLNSYMQIIHAIWVDDEDIDIIASAGCSIAHNPVCNLRLGSGVMPFRKIRERRINICLGSDELCTDDTTNMWFVGKVAGLIHSLTDPDYSKWPKAKEILWALTRGGARAMLLENQCGVLAPGYEADLILLDLNKLAFTPLNDLYRQLVYCETGSSVVLTMVAGRIVVQDGKVLTVDEEAVKAEVREVMKPYRKIAQEAESAAARLEPYYREMYLRAAATEVGMNRWVGQKTGGR